MSATELVADLEESAELVAVIVMVLGEGSAEGAVKLPEESIVPREEEPLEVPLTVHVTVVLVAPETLAEKVAVLPTRTLAEVGEMVTAMAGVGGGWVLLEVEAEPQPGRVQQGNRSVAQRRGAGMRIAILIFEAA
jgi:hypothetical protein